MPVVLVDAELVLLAASAAYERLRPPPEFRGRDSGGPFAILAKAMLDAAVWATRDPLSANRVVGLTLQELELIEADLNRAVDIAKGGQGEGEPVD